MNIGTTTGNLLGLAIFAAISALVIKLAVKLVSGKGVGFAKPFIISFVSVSAAVLIQMCFDDVRSRSAFIDALPGFIFFLSCWLLNAQLIKYGGEINSRSYGKTFLVTVLQGVGLLIIMTVFSLVLTAILSSISAPSR